MAFSWVTIRLGLASLPERSTWLHLYGVALLTGIGFTMSLFIGTLAFRESSLRRIRAHRRAHRVALVVALGLCDAVSRGAAIVAGGFEAGRRFGFDSTDEAAMQIQLNTDNQIVGSDDLALRVEGELRTALARFSERITRIEVHLNDLNSDKAGGGDKRCMMEARPAGRQPISVSHQAPTIALAIDGALEKLVRALDRMLGKRDADRRSGAKLGGDDAI